ncbi:TadE family protein [Paenibacillus sp. PL2-23]|uniref:TadE/TadG family type IV pilus assembly protein n=1 Tax=Paenibacillus sp. PL2-23 TaxID=2100729 RepID=UPI0030F5F339
MQGKYLNSLQSWREDQRGSFTLEAVTVFPVLLAMVLAFLFLGMYLYQQTIVLYAASVTAERAAFSWDNSNREPETGMLLSPSYDSLYRNLGSDGALASVFGLRADSANHSVEWPAEGGDGTASAERGQGGGPAGKLLAASEWMAVAQLPYRGTVSYKSGGLRRSVEVKLRHPLSLSSWEKGWTRGEAAAAGQGIVVDPVEFVRSVDLARYYWRKFADYPNGRTTARSRAGEVLSSYGQATP